VIRAVNRSRTHSICCDFGGEILRQLSDFMTHGYQNLGFFRCVGADVVRSRGADSKFGIGATTAVRYVRGAYPGRYDLDPLAE
jgi:hypothetical protein